MKDKVLNPGRLGRSDNSLTNGFLVWADIGADMINTPDPITGPLHIMQISHLPNHSILNAQGSNQGDLFRPVDQCAHHLTLSKQCLQDCPAGFTS